MRLELGFGAGVQTVEVPDSCVQQVLLPNEVIAEQAESVLTDKNQLILVYCRSGNRSKQAAGKLAALGYTNVVEFGGINDWPGETVAGEG